jgi:hypothetical protein
VHGAPDKILNGYIFPLIHAAAGIDSARAIDDQRYDSLYDTYGVKRNVDAFELYKAHHLRGVVSPDDPAIFGLPALFNPQRREMPGIFSPADCERWTVDRRSVRRSTCKQEWLGCSCRLLATPDDAIQFEELDSAGFYAFREVVSEQAPDKLSPPSIRDKDYGHYMLTRPEGFEDFMRATHAEMVMQGAIESDGKDGDY